MFTLDEAIKRSEEAERKEGELYDICPATETEWLHCDGTKDCKAMMFGKDRGCIKLANEHKQMAEWLKELKLLKEQDTNAILDNIKEEIKTKIEQEEFARSVFRHEEKDNVKAEQCTGSIMAYNNVIKLIDRKKVRVKNDG